MRPCSRAIFLALRPLTPISLFARKQGNPNRPSIFVLLARQYSAKNRTVPTSTPAHYRHAQLLLHADSVSTLRKVHSSITTNGLASHTSLAGDLVRRYIDLGSPETAICVFHAVQKPTLHLQNMAVRWLSDRELYSDVLTFYGSLQRRDGHHSDNFTYPFVIKACAAIHAPLAGREVHCRLLRGGYEGNVVVQTALLDMYGKTGQLRFSRQVFDGMPHRDLVSWNALLSAYSLNGFDLEAFETFRQILESGFVPNASTLVTVVPVCARLGAVDSCRCLHGLALKTGSLCTQSLMPTLISMYAGFGELSVSEVLFRKTSDKDLVSWNAMISAYTQNGDYDGTIQLLHQMHHCGIKPTLITLVTTLPACGYLNSIRCGESLHACGFKLGYLNKVPVVTSLLSMYAKSGDLAAAEYIFNAMPHKNLLSWNAMVSGYVLNGHWYGALDTFHEMLLAGIKPDSISLISLLSACSKSRELQNGKPIHAFVLRNGLDADQNMMNALMAMYSDCYQFSTSLKLFHMMLVMNPASWNTLISGSAQLGDFETSLALFRKMLKEAVRFDIVTMISILPAFCHGGNLAAGKSFHCHAIIAGYFSDISLANALITMYMNCDELDDGYLLFNSLPLKDVVSWNVVLTGFRNHSCDLEVIHIFNQMILSGERPNSITLLNILHICKDQKVGRSCHGYAVRNLIVFEDSLLTSIMCMYARFDRVNLCLLLFELANKSNVAVWNAIMSVLVQSMNSEKAVANFLKMLELKLELDHVTVLSLLAACSHLGSMDLALCVTAYIIKNSFERVNSVSNSLIDLFARCGNLAMARDLFDGMIEKDPISWSAIINGYGMHGNGEASLALFTEMQQTGIEPDNVTFLSVLSACSHAGLVEEGRNIFKSMTEDHHVAPKMEHTACMVDLFSRAGYLDEAYDLIRKNPSKTTASMLESLLGACRNNGDLKLGQEIGLCLFQAQPDSSRSFIMLSNIYAAAGRWGDSCTVRSDMEARGLRKEHGFSLIEVQ